jgi:hypothetical protein
VSNKARFLVPAFLLLGGVGLVLALYGERLSPGHGLGWDGRFYAEIARDPHRAVFVDGLSEYRLQRVLPSLVVHGALRALGRPLDDAEIVRGFAVYNLVLLLGTLLVWDGICGAAAVSGGGRWLGFLLLFVSFGHLKMPFFYPVLTDTTALFLGALLVHLHLRDRGWATLAVLVAGAFTWPSFLLLAAPMYLLSPGTLDAGALLARGRRVLVAIAASAAYVANLAVHLPGRGVRISEVEPVDERWLPLSIALAVAFVAAMASGLLGHRGLWTPASYRARLHGGRVVAWISVVVAVRLVLRLLADGTRTFDLGMFLRQIALQSVLKPGLFVVAHAVYLGLVTLLLLLCWPAVCRAAHRAGPGLTLFVAAVLVQGLTTESRQIEHGAAALVLLAVLAVENQRWPAWGSVVLTAVAAAGTKVWFGINHEGFSGKSLPTTYPSQYYFMNIGPWMAWPSYVLQGACVVAALGALALVLHGARPMTAAEREVLPLPPRPGRRARTAFAAILVLVAIELAARRALEHRPTADGDGSRADARLGWVNVPGATVRARGRDFDIETRWNADGQRGPDRPVTKAEGVRRIVLLGGDAAEGLGVPEERTIRSVLEETLKARGCTRTEVIDAGVAGYAVDQAYLSYEAARRYQPDVVVLVAAPDDLAHLVSGVPGKPTLRVDGERLVVAADSASGRARLREPDPEGPRVRWHGSAALRIVRNRVATSAPRLLLWLEGLGVLERDEPPPELWPFGPRDETGVIWTLGARVIEALRDEAAADHARLIVLYAPAAIEVDDGAWQRTLDRYRMSLRFWKRDKVAKRLESVADAAGVTFVDPRAVLAAAAAEGHAPYHPRDGLWNADGHAVAARLTAEAVAPAWACAGPKP